MARHAHSAATSGQIRIIGGQWRGRKLPVADVSGLRPTTDRVRETLFNWLMFELQGARVVDLFAGSGALGFEAASRGASEVILVERHEGVARTLAANIARLQAADRLQLVVADALRFAASPPAEPCDLLFVDPPFGQGLLRELLPLLASPAWLRPGGWLYVEHESALALSPPPGFSAHRQLKAGAATAQLWQRQ